MPTSSQNSLNPTIQYCSSLDDYYAGQLATLIAQENANKTIDSWYSAMIPKTAHQLQQQMQWYWWLCCIDTTKKVLISALVLSKLGDYTSIPVYELGSVITHPLYQNKGYAKQLMQTFCTLSLPENGIVVIVGTSDKVNTMYRTYFSDSFPCVSRDRLQSMHPALFTCINTPPLGPRDHLFLDSKSIRTLWLSC